jgi:hypothetical protein
MDSRLASISFALLVTGSVGVIASACGTSGDSVFNDGADGGDNDPGGQHNQDGSFDFDSSNTIDPDAFFAKDPPPQWCGPAGTSNPSPVPGGTPDCPDDKNREGCPCPESGKQAACWPGLRVNRNMGVCKDGVTTCKQSGEFTKTWGPCVGAVLPTPGVKTGKAACRCFSEGQWKLENLNVWFQTYGANNKTYGISMYQDPVTGKATAPKNLGGPPPPTPAEDWTKDTLKVDCAGHFNLCYELKAGDFSNPKPTDCSIIKVCTGEFDYLKEDVEQQLPSLKGWVSVESASACSVSFHTGQGYGEMSVVGKSVLCDAIDDGSGQPFVFNRVKYCKASCSEPDAGADPECANCGQNGSGVFH